MATKISARKIKVVSGNDPKRLDASEPCSGTNHAHSHRRTGSTEGENTTNVFRLTSPSSVSPSGSAEERKKGADPGSPLRSASLFTLEGRRTWSARAWVCVRGTEKACVREREMDREKEGGAARVRRSSPGMRSVEFPARPLRPEPSPPRLSLRNQERRT